MGTPEIRQTGINNITCGENVVICQPANLYGCTLEDDVFIGPFVEIQRNSVIGAHSRVQSHSFICEYVTIGQHCFIGHNVTFANDLFRQGAPDPDPASWGRTRIGHHVSIGSGSTLLAVTVCDGAVIGAGSVVTRSIEVKGIYAGNPARLLRRL